MSDKINANYGSAVHGEMSNTGAQEVTPQGDVNLEGKVANEILKSSQFKDELKQDAFNPTPLEVPKKTSIEGLDKLEGVGLEQLLSFISGETKTANLSRAEKMIKSNAADRKARYEETMQKLNENIEKAKKEATAKKVSGIFGWIANIVTAVVSLVVTVGSLFTGNFALAAVSALGLYSSISSMVAQATGEGLTEQLLKKMKCSDEVAKYLGLGLDMAGGILGGLVAGGAVVKTLSGLSNISVRLATVSAKVINWTRFASSAMQVGKTAAGMAQAKYSFDASYNRADMKELDALIEKLNAENSNYEKMFKAIMEHFKNMTEGVEEVVKNKNQTAMKVATLQPGSGGAA